MLTRFDPFRDLDHLVDQLTSNRTTTDNAMPLDIARGPNGYVVHADLPGVRSDSIDLSVEGNVLTIRAQRATTVAEDMQMLASERPRGSFVRQLTIGDGFDMDKVDASYVDGVLTVTLPVSEAAKPRRIAVKDQSSSPPIHAMST